MLTSPYRWAKFLFELPPPLVPREDQYKVAIQQLVDDYMSGAELGPAVARLEKLADNARFQ